MNRRDFLFLRSTSADRTLDLSCRRLYMRYVDAALPAVLGELDGDLKNIDVLRMREREWLTSTALGDQIAPLLAAFRARGGRVE